VHVRTDQPQRTRSGAVFEARQIGAYSERAWGDSRLGRMLADGPVLVVSLSADQLLSGFATCMPLRWEASQSIRIVRRARTRLDGDRSGAPVTPTDRLIARSSNHHVSELRCWNSRRRPTRFWPEPRSRRRSPTVAVVGKEHQGRQVDRFGLVVVDPVRAFTDPSGRIGQIHHAAQFGVILETVDRLACFAAAHSGPKVWITSHYAPGQFSGGDLEHPLAQLCADPAGDDCSWNPQLPPPPDAVVVTKTSMDAGSSQSFADATEGMANRVDALLITGFWLSACVATTATSCAERLAGRVPVVVPLSLAATRLALYDATDDHPADIDVTRRLHQLRTHGVVVCDRPNDWRNELTRCDGTEHP
jgi:nicotinamidase-related amidase